MSLLAEDGWSDELIAAAQINPDDVGPLHFVWKCGENFPSHHVAVIDGWKFAYPRWKICVWTDASPLFNSSIEICSFASLLEKPFMSHKRLSCRRDLKDVKTFIQRYSGPQLLSELERQNVIDVMKHFIVWTSGGIVLDIEVLRCARLAAHRAKRYTERK
jgi:hypothetical protein